MIDKGSIGIGALGCRYLIQSNWKNLTDLFLSTFLLTLGNNEIEDNGCQYLIRSDWKSLKHLYLGT